MLTRKNVQGCELNNNYDSNTMTTSQSRGLNWFLFFNFGLLLFIKELFVHSLIGFKILHSFPLAEYICLEQLLPQSLFNPMQSSQDTLNLQRKQKSSFRNEWIMCLYLVNVSSSLIFSTPILSSLNWISSFFLSFFLSTWHGWHTDLSLLLYMVDNLWSFVYMVLFWFGLN